MTEAAGADELEVLVFEVGSQRYALAASSVKELARAVTVVRLPKAPPVVEGVVDVRGAVVAVLDVRSRFRLAARPLDPADHLVLAWAGTRLVALRVDRALDLVRLAADAVEDAKRVAPGAEYVAGVAKLPDGLVLIHDLRTFLSEAEAAALGEALAGGPA